MKKIYYGALALFMAALFLLSGCSSIGEKSMSLSIIYAATTILSLLLLIFYCSCVRKKDSWFLLLFASVFVVNAGYLTLSLSTSVEEALLANRIAYLGSAFLPLSILMIVSSACKITFPKWISGLLVGISSVMFLIASSPGYSDVYYRAVTLDVVNGVAVLHKVYGPWHKLYLIYLLSYFTAMAAVILFSAISKRIRSTAYTLSLAAAAFVNLFVWFVEQLVQINFEFLSISYIITELFLLCIYFLMQERQEPPVQQEIPQETPEPAEIPADCTLPETECEEVPDEEHDSDSLQEYFISQLPRLTPTEHMIYDYYLSGKSTKEIMDTLNIKENTLKYHNKNIYSKLGVSSRKQLLEIASSLEQLHEQD